MQSAFDIAADLDTPVSAYLKLAPFQPRFLLESVEGGERLARYSFIGFGDADEFRLQGDRCVMNGEQLPAPSSPDELQPTSQGIGARSAPRTANTRRAVPGRPSRVDSV